jgi:5-methylcytosine-specific restriction protein A
MPRAEHHALYGQGRWKRLRRLQMAKHPLCCMCEEAGRVEPAVLVDHIKPAKDNIELFFDMSNLQSLCRLCHDSSKRKDERRGYSTQIGEDGWPVDGNHPIHRVRSAA